MPHGRLADPDATLGTDPRADPRMVEVFRRFGLDGRFPSSGLTPDSPAEERHAFAAMSEQAIGAIFDSIAEDLGRPDGVTTTTTECIGADPCCALHDRQFWSEVPEYVDAQGPNQ